ncbi:MAG: S9 family peptidase, partial [Alphaproteobacteria bacterium]
MNKSPELPPPPRAEQRLHKYQHHGIEIEDPWHWLRDQGYPNVTDENVLAYLKAENAYFDAWAEPNRALIEQLFEEMKGRIKEDESSVPIRDGDWLYWWAFKPGAQYRSWYRKPVAGGEDELIYDEVAEAEGKEYFRLGALEVSPDGRLLAIMTDTSGAERFTLKVRDLATAKDIETITEVGIGSPVWTSDSKGLVFTEVNENWRSYRARYHRLGTPVEEDKTLYEETEDLGFSVAVDDSQDRSLIFIATGDNVTTEVRFVPADNPLAEPVVVSPRKEGREYAVDAAHGKLWITANDDHVNFRLAEADPANPGEWHTLIEGSDRVYIMGAASYRDHLAIHQRVDGLDQLILRTYDGKETRIPFGEASYSAGFAGNPEFAPEAYRIGYSSMVTPSTVYDYYPQS